VKLPFFSFSSLSVAISFPSPCFVVFRALGTLCHVQSAVLDLLAIVIRLVYRFLPDHFLLPVLVASLPLDACWLICLTGSDSRRRRLRRKERWKKHS
jgi:hypothetical protein